MRQSSSPPGQLAVMLHRFGRMSLLLTTIVAVGATGGSSAPAAAASRHTAHHGHGGGVRTTSKPSRHAARGQHKRNYARSHPARDATHHAAATHPHHATAMHQGVVPLTNTTWDDPQIPPAVMDAIQTAARESGVDPHLLIAIAWRESRFDPNARNRQSSAKGLLQFTTGTWLQVVRAYGSQHDAGGYAAAIQRDHSGELVVSGKGMRAAILRLRSDPVLSAKLAAHSMSQQRTVLQEQLGREVAPADLYLLHVLGPTGAARFLTAVARHPAESSVEVASYDVLRNAGLLARDSRPMTVGNTYAAAGAMLDAQHARSAAPPSLATKAGEGGNMAAAVQVSAAP